MVDWQLLISGVVIGLAVAAPIGPINLMAIRNTLRGGFWDGVFTGLGAVLGDGTFAVVAAFGLTAVSGLVMAQAHWIQGIGGAVLIAVGVHTILTASQTPRAAQDTGARRSLALVATTYLLTITNPATMMGFIAIFSGLGGFVSAPGNYAAAALLVGAVMLGSLLWWIIVSWLASLLEARMGEGWMKYINWSAGAVIAIFGAGVLAGVVFL